MDKTFTTTARSVEHDTESRSDPLRRGAIAGKLGSLTSLIRDCGEIARSRMYEALDESEVMPTHGHIAGG
jgi:hypothetical protein